MSTLIKDNGVWKEPEMIYVKDAGVWKEVGGGDDSEPSPVIGNHWVAPYSPNDQLNSVIQFKDKWIAASGFNRVRVSQDAWYWEARNFHDEWGLGYFSVQDMAAEDGILVAVGGDGAGGSRLLTTLDGETWIEPVTGLPAQEFRCVAKGAGRWLALGRNGNIVTSTDNGATWTTQATNGGWIKPNGIAHANGLWVAVSSSGRIATSLNGLTWTQQNSGLTGTSHDLYCIANADGLWVAGSRSGKILTSNIGYSWVERYSGSSTHAVHRITKVGSMWVAVGGYNTVLLSHDGKSWSRITGAFGNTDNYYGLFLGTNALVAVGQRGISVSF